jgi:hypothetical protein
MRAPENPHQKDAEAAGRYAAEFMRPRKAYMRDCPLDVVANLARWAGHWGRLALAVAGR